MNTYICLLRGINVSGQKIIKMDDLRNLFNKLNYSNVKTYIQSGNIIFNSEQKNKSTLLKTIREGIQERYNFSVEVLIKQKTDFENIVKNNPFKKDKNIDYKKVYISLLYSNPEISLINKINEYPSNNDVFIIKDNIIYVYCPGGYGKSKLSNNFFENKLKVFSTTRNWNTVNKLMEIANEI